MRSREKRTSKSVLLEFVGHKDKLELKIKNGEIQDPGFRMTTELNVLQEHVDKFSRLGKRPGPTDEISVVLRGKISNFRSLESERQVGRPDMHGMQVSLERKSLTSAFQAQDGYWLARLMKENRRFSLKHGKEL